MGAFFETADVLRAKRLNRMRLAALVASPFYDVNDAGATTVAVLPVDGQSITNIGTTIWGGSGAYSLLHSFTICNVSAAPRAVFVHLYPVGVGVTVATALFHGTLYAYQTLRLRGDWYAGPGSGLHVWSDAATTSELSIRADVITFAVAPTGVSAAPTTGVALDAVWQTAYTCPTGVEHANAWVTLANTSTAGAVLCGVQIIPAGGGSTWAQVIFWSTLQPGQTVLIGDPTAPLILQPGDGVSLYAGLGATVGARVNAYLAAVSP
jgi:hypothetical protein